MLSVVGLRINALEREIVEKFRLLDKAAQQRVRLQIDHEVGNVNPADTQSMSADEWLKWAVSFGEYIHDKYGTLHPSLVDLLEEAREERLNDLMGGR